MARLVGLMRLGAAQQVNERVGDPASDCRHRAAGGAGESSIDIKVLVMFSSYARIVATRQSKTRHGLIEILCVRTGLHKQYRVYTTYEENLEEAQWDLDAAEFDSVDEESVTTYLVESFWALKVGLNEMEEACRLVEMGVSLPPMDDISKRAIYELGDLGVLLLEGLSRIQTVRLEQTNDVDCLKEIDLNLARLERLNGLPASVIGPLQACRRVYRQLVDEVEQRRRQNNH